MGEPGVEFYQDGIKRFSVGRLKTILESSQSDVCALFSALALWTLWAGLVFVVACPIEC